MKLLLKAMPWLFLALFLTEIIAITLPKKDGVFHEREFGRLPVLMNGRIQPFDSVARNSLLQIRSTADVPLEEVPSWKFWHHPKKLKATAWLLEVMCLPNAADERPIFLIHHPDLLSELKIADKGVERSGLRYYTFNQLKAVIPEIIVQRVKAEKLEEQLRNSSQRQVIKLGNAIELYRKLKNIIRPEGRGNFSTDLALLQPLIDPGVAAFQAKAAGQTFDQVAYERLAEYAESFDELRREPGAGLLYPLIVPPPNPTVSRDDWGNLGMGIIESIRNREILPQLNLLALIASSYQEGNAAGFNEAVTDYAAWLAKYLPEDLAKGRHEFFFNDLNLFLHAMIIYLFAFLLTAGGLLTLGVFSELSESLRRSAFYLILLAGMVHTAGLVFRMVLEGRPPVTNLYSSAIFIGWGAMILGLILERVYRIGLGNVVASIAGFVTLMIAHNLAIGGDTMEMMRAVLDNNFWLATHVVVVTLGYASTFVAGLLAIIYVLLGLLTPVLSRRLTPQTPAGKSEKHPAKKASLPSAQADVGKALAKMVYGIVCFATLFSFVGTVLGGIWADQSWGRFWGWDPKENGALLIVLWNATILHARWGGLVRERGLMNMAIFGNILTSFSWFGVNMLGIGLHSYGFMDAAFNWLILFIISQVCLMILGCLPKSMWRSFRAQTHTS